MSVYKWFLMAIQVNIALSAPPKFTPTKFYDVQGHRGGRGDEIENTLPAFARGLLNGVTTLELDNGITKDGVVVVWHDEQIMGTKCQDTVPAFKDDPDFPYVGKFIANLTLAQVKTLDCGSKRLQDFPLQMTAPGTRISTLKEVFAFARCADPRRDIFWNIESKVNPEFPGTTRAPEDFVELQLADFLKSGYPLSQITYQSFDWRTLISMKKVNNKVPLAALISASTVTGSKGSPSVWLAGLDINNFPGTSQGEQIANAAAEIGAGILSPAATGTSPVPDPSQPGYVPFTTKEMIDRAHELGISVIPWTVDRLNIAQQLLNWKVDGIISDYSIPIRRLVQQNGLRVRPPFVSDVVERCLRQHL